MAPIVLSAGRGTLRGRIVDQDGMPLVGVPVQVHPDETEAPDGAFVCRHVPAMRVKVQGHAEGSLLQDGDPNRLQQPMQPVPVDMSSRTEVDHDAVRRADTRSEQRHQSGGEPDLGAGSPGDTEDLEDQFPHRQDKHDAARHYQP